MLFKKNLICISIYFSRKPVETQIPMEMLRTLTVFYKALHFYKIKYCGNKRIQHGMR
jgi:hypothetical protein